ncbi:CarD family transcriptional regulator [Rubeoparvulum massiliense]|uniref:CarD family transcriptional regulator n=1 Tax=Rubeoparvulum massiliense TaxID=1631346 RepID=UPI00065E428E|nr:CarD family transcriptional regulator [Rubeoparvulum massiliense]
MFHVGDRVVYPMHGAGIIDAIEEKEILGKRNKYYILRLPFEKMQVMVPVGNAGHLHIRPVVDQETIEEVFELFLQDNQESQLPWKERAHQHNEHLKSGDIFDVAKVICELKARQRSKPLNTSEKNLLENAKRIFISEFLLVKNISQEQALSILQQAFTIEPS